MGVRAINQGLSKRQRPAGMRPSPGGSCSVPAVLLLLPARVPPVVCAHKLSASISGPFDGDVLRDVEQNRSDHTELFCRGERGDSAGVGAAGESGAKRPSWGKGKERDSGKIFHIFPGFGEREGKPSVP